MINIILYCKENPQYSGIDADEVLHTYCVHCHDTWYLPSITMVTQQQIILVQPPQSTVLKSRNKLISSRECVLCMLLHKHNNLNKLYRNY